MHRRTKIIASVAGILCGLSVLLLLGFEYTLSGKKAALLSEQEKIWVAKQKATRLSSLEKLAAETVTERESLKEFILTDEEVVDFLSLIETIAKEQGVSIKTGSLEVVPQSDLFEELKMTLVVEGYRAGVVHALRLFEALPYRVSVESVALVRSEGMEAWQGTFDLRVTKYKKKP